MNISFFSPKSGVCLLKLWASGRYGFSLPKKVEITTGTGTTAVFLYNNRRLGLKDELTNRALIRIAIAQFLESDGEHPATVELDDGLAPFAGMIAPVPSSAPGVGRHLRPGRPRASTMNTE